jgi:hypothetical protein
MNDTPKSAHGPEKLKAIISDPENDAILEDPDYFSESSSNNSSRESPTYKIARVLTNPFKKPARSGTIKFNKIENLEKVTPSSDYNIINIKKGNPPDEISLGESNTESNSILRDKEPKVGVTDDESIDGENIGKTGGIGIGIDRVGMYTIRESQGDSTLRERRLDGGGETSGREGGEGLGE